MAKTKARQKGGGGKGNKGKGSGGGGATNDYHDARTAKRIASLNKKRHRKELALVEKESAADGQAEYEAPNKRQKSKEPNHPLPIHQQRPKKQSRKHIHRLSSHLPSNTYKRSHLAHDSYDQIESSKLRLATKQTQRKVDALRERLENWDPIEEAKRAQDEADGNLDDNEMAMKLHAKNRMEDEQARTLAQHDQNLLNAKCGVNGTNSMDLRLGKGGLKRRKANLKKKARPGPESWKLRGAARPAWEVYDFDTRYVDVHLKAKEEANEKARRVRNILVLCKGRFAEDGNENPDTNDSSDQQLYPPPQPQCQQYLTLLTQLASLHLHSKRYSSARSTFLTILELEGYNHPSSITNARNQLMNMYLSTNRPASARKLWERLPNDTSAWIRYSAALVEYVSWNLLGESGSSRESAERLLAQAIRGNVYVVYLLGWKDVMGRAMEYLEELVEGGEYEGGSGGVLEAIEYFAYGCVDENENEDGGDEGAKGMRLWMETEGSLEWARSVVLRVLNGEDGVGESGLTRADLLSWEVKLAKEEEEFEKERNEKKKLKKEIVTDTDEDNDQHGEDVADEDEEPDLLMYAGMFRTGMDWLQDAGEFLQAPSYNYLNEEENGGDVNDKRDDKDDGANDTPEVREKKNGQNKNAQQDESTGSESGSDSDGSEE